jgi:hypothetical protein
MNNFKLLCAWIFYGLFQHCTFEEYKVTKTFVGPPRKTTYQECLELIDQMRPVNHTRIQNDLDHLTARVERLQRIVKEMNT